LIWKNDLLLITRRKENGLLGGFWEFPGGKTHPKESLEDALEREVFEELGIEIIPRYLLCEKTHYYPKRKVHLYFYFCDYVSGTPARHGCRDFRWVAPAELRSFRFPPADQEVINELVNRISRR